jgi:hypothetical protein
MKIIDAYILARTKRKTRRIRTALVTVVSALLFAILFFGAFLAAGIVQSANQVKDVGFNSRYLTSIASVGKPGWDFEQVSNTIYGQMDSELRAKKVTVDQNTRQDPSYLAEYSRRLMDVITTKATEDVKKFEATLPTMGNPTNVYHFKMLGLNDSLTHHTDFTTDPKVKELESIAQTQAEAENKDPLARMEFFSVEKDMLRTQLAPGQTFDWQPGQPIPVVLPYPYLERLAGKSFANIDAATKNKAYTALIAEYSGKEIPYCHRNQAAQAQLQDVVAHNQAVTKDKDKTTNPITIPVCGDFDQKLLKKLGIVVEPSATEPKPLFKAPVTPAAKTTRMAFKIVGFIPGQDQFNSDILSSIFSGVSLLPFASNPAIVPAEVAKVEPLLVPTTNDGFTKGQEFLFVDFANRADQKAFIANGCQGDECMNGDKPFIAPFGNISVALEGIFTFMTNIIVGVVIAMMAIAAVMILFTISKVIADSTKEIAVFRALGARRRDIAQIYYTYGSMLAVSALLFAMIIAAAGAYAMNMLFGDRFAATLVQAVGAYTQEPQVNLLGVEPLWVVAVAAALLLAAAVGITIPVLAALKRKLITILREE